MGSTATRRSPCPVAAALDVLGDRWTLLVLRDMVFWGRQYYQEFVSSPERIATNTLADRLLRLQESGIITQEPDPDDGRRHRYVLTEQGLAAIPLLLDLVIWGAQLDPALGYPAPVLRWISNDRDEVIRYYRQKLLTRDPSRADAPHRLPGTRV